MRAAPSSRPSPARCEGVWVERGHHRDQLAHGQLLSAIGTTLQSAVVGYALAVLVGVIVGGVVSRIPPLRAAVRAAIGAT